MDPVQLRRLYAERRNILSHLRNSRGLDVNDELSIMLSYDLQSGSYIQSITKDPFVAEQHRISANKLAQVLDRLRPDSFLDAGIGEATMACSVLNAMKRPPRHRYGFDVALSRLLYGQIWSRKQGQPNLKLFQGSLLAIPILADTFDVVFTNHAIEPNRDKEREILAELYRVSRRYLVLREPSWQFGDDASRAWIEHHRYIKDIPDALRDLGYEVVEHAPFGEGDANPRNRSALTIVEKRDRDLGTVPTTPFPESPYASPFAKTPLVVTGEALYSDDDALVFPIISGIPCLLGESGIFSTHYGNCQQAALAHLS